MNQLLYILLIVSLSCTHPKESTQETTIEGKITGDIPERIEYTLPINGITYVGFENAVQPDSLGNFKISLPLDKASFIELSNGHEAYCTIIAEPAMSYQVIIKVDEGKTEFVFEGENAKGQELYNQNTNRTMLLGHFELEARKYAKDSVPADIRKSLEKSKQSVLADYKKLLNSHIISESFYELVRIDQNYFYAGAQTSIALMNYLLSERQKNVLSQDEYTHLWGEAFQSFPVSNPDLMRSPWFYYYVTSYLWYKYFIEQNVDAETLSKIRNQGLIHTHNIELAKTYLSGDQLEYYFAAYLYMEAINKNYEKELVTLFEQFNKAYPSSEFTHFIESEIIPIITFHQKQGGALNVNTHFINGDEHINSLKDAVEKIESERVYVDVWATWCGPCKKEFQHNSKLYDLLKKEKTTMLYVSIDTDERSEKWKEMIKYYQLEGYHIRANKKLMEDLRLLRGDDALGIPWHILTDSKGNIVKKYVSGPSEIQNLEKQLREN